MATLTKNDEKIHQAQYIEIPQTHGQPEWHTDERSTIIPYHTGLTHKALPMIFGLSVQAQGAWISSPDACCRLASLDLLYFGAPRRHISSWKAARAWLQPSDIVGWCLRLFFLLKSSTCWYSCFKSEWCSVPVVLSSEILADCDLGNMVLKYFQNLKVVFWFFSSLFLG